MCYSEHMDFWVMNPPEGLVALYVVIATLVVCGFTALRRASRR
jgi:hypothetical protein